MPEPHPVEATSVGTVILDIGGSTGALLVYTPTGQVGAEIEIRRRCAPWRGQHIAVRERRAANKVFFAGLFPALEAGNYEIRWRGDSRGPRRVVDVAPGLVTETTLIDHFGVAIRARPAW